MKLQNVPLLNGMRVEDEMDDKGRLGIKLILTEAAGEVVFLDFVEFISGALAPVTDLKKVNATLRQELQRWKKFFFRPISFKSPEYHRFGWRNYDTRHAAWCSFFGKQRCSNGMGGRGKWPS